MNTSTLYRITASYSSGGHPITSDRQYEMLGEEGSRLYVNRADAESTVEDMQDDVEELGLDESTTYAVEDVEISVHVRGVTVESNEDDDDTGNGGDHVVDANVYLGVVCLRGTWNAKVEPGSNGERLAPSDDAIGVWSDAITLADYDAEVANVIGLAVLESVTQDQIVNAVSEAASR